MPKMIDAEVAAVSEQLRNQFLLYREGERLPSYRSPLESCRCSRQTLTLVLRRLAKERVVRSEPRRGMFACGGGGRVRRILFFRVDWNCEHANRISEELQYEFSLRRNYVYTEQRYAPDQLEREIGKFSQRHCDLLILWLEEVEPQILLSLFRLRIPMVFFDCGIMLHGAAILDMQEELMGMLAAKHLVENGHRRIALLLTEPKGLTCTKKINGFCDYLHLYGITPRLVDCNIRHGEASRSTCGDFLLEYFQAHRIDFTACFAMSDYSALAVMESFKVLGKRIPDEISIVGCQGEMAGEKCDPPLTTVVFDAREIARKLAAGVDGFFAGGDFGICRVPPLLIPRGSVRRISPEVSQV